jgi:cell division protein FtsB
VTAKSPGETHQPDRPPSAAPRAGDRRRAWARVVAVALVTAAGMFAVRMADISLATRRAERAEQDLALDVQTLAGEVAAVKTASADAESDEGVERWAREERGWAREGDQVYALGGPTPSVTPPADGAAPGGRLERLRRWLTDLLH